MIASLSIGFSNGPTDSEVLNWIIGIVQEFIDADSNLYLGLSFLFLTIIFTVLFKQGTARMLPNHSNGAMTISIVAAIFASVGILSREAIGESDNALATIGSTILVPLLLLALFGGMWALYRGIQSAQVSGFAKILMYIGALVIFLFVFLQIMALASQTAFNNVVNSGIGEGIKNFFYVLLGFFAFIFVVALLFFFFTVREFLDLFEEDDESVVGQARKKKKQKQEAEQNILEKLEQLKKSLHKMRNTYDDKTDTLKQISRLESISEMVDRAEEIPQGNGYGRGFAPDNNQGGRY